MIPSTQQAPAEPLPTRVSVLTHAPNDAGNWLSRLDRRTHDVSWGQRVHLSRFWEDLCVLRKESVLVFASQQSWRVLLEIPMKLKRLSSEKQQLMRRCLLGESQKTIAYSRQRSPSAVSSNFSGALASIGLRGDWRRALVLFTTAANSLEGNTPLYATAQDFAWRGRHWRAFMAERCDFFDRETSAAEAAVGQLLVQGFSYAEIARQRGVSTRTVANQIGALFRKYGVSGRSALIQRLVTLRLNGAH